MRFHLIGMPHCPTSKRHNVCAYTQKVYKFAQMMLARGHEVHHYGVEGSDLPCTSHTNTVKASEWQEWYGGVDERESVYPIVWDSKDITWATAAARTIYYLSKRVQPRDFLCFIAGTQKPIHDAIQPMGRTISVEYGIGYYGTFAPHRAFESYAHANAVMCQFRDASATDGVAFDAVIPNYWDTDDFTYVEKPAGWMNIDCASGESESGWKFHALAPSQPYCLYLGRLINRKGIEIAVEATRRAGVKLIMAGQAPKDVLVNGVLNVDGLILPANHVTFVGHVTPERRSELMGNATCLICPSKYLEPFGGVTVEAMMCGTPIVTSDWGAFPEINDHGVTGWRCRTLEQFAWAVGNCGALNREYIARRARAKWSLERVGILFEEWFESLLTLWGEGYYEKVNRRQPWLRP